jgi:hypothetical protein
VKFPIRFRSPIVIITKQGFDVGVYNRSVILDALTSQLNINGTREEHCCSNAELLEHLEWLIDHYSSSGGLEWAEQNLRPKCFKEVETPLLTYLLNKLVQVLRNAFRHSFLKEKTTKKECVINDTDRSLSHLFSRIKRVCS